MSNILYFLKITFAVLEVLKYFKCSLFSNSSHYCSAISFSICLTRAKTLFWLFSQSWLFCRFVHIVFEYLGQGSSNFSEVLIECFQVFRKALKIFYIQISRLPIRWFEFVRFGNSCRFEFLMLEAWRVLNIFSHTFWKRLIRLPSSKSLSLVYPGFKKRFAMLLIRSIYEQDTSVTGADSKLPRNLSATSPKKGEKRWTLL